MPRCTRRSAAAAIFLASSVLAAGCGSSGAQNAGGAVRLHGHHAKREAGGTTSTTAPGAPQSGPASTPTPPAASALQLAPASTLTGVVFGIDTPTPNDQRVVAELGRPPSAIDGFYGWNEPFPSSFVSSVLGLGATPMITWMPASGRPNKGNVSGYSLGQITGGAADTYITQWAAAAKAVGHPVLVRLMHEMNGNWYPWGAGVEGNTPEAYVAAFRHVVDVFRQAGATNVQFVWCVATSAASSLGTTAHTPISAFFPGDAYVSWVAMDGYDRSASDLKPFAEIFSGVYAQLTSLSARPVMIAEFGVVSNPSDPAAKAQWISTTYASLPAQFPRIKAVFYFDSKGNGYTYPFDGDPSAIAALKSALDSPAYRATVPAQTLSY